MGRDLPELLGLGELPTVDGVRPTAAVQPDRDLLVAHLEDVEPCVVHGLKRLAGRPNAPSPRRARAAVCAGDTPPAGAAAGVAGCGRSPG